MSRNLVINSYFAILFITIAGVIATVTIIRVANKNQEIATNNYTEASYSNLKNSLLNIVPASTKAR